MFFGNRYGVARLHEPEPSALSGASLVGPEQGRPVTHRALFPYERAKVVIDDQRQLIEPDYPCGMAMEDEHRLSARRAVEIIRRELTGGDPNFAFRTLAAAVRDLHDTSPDNREDFLVPPESSGSIRWDTLFAGVVGRECTRLGIPRPTWTLPEPLTEEWIVTTLPAPSQDWLAGIKRGTPEEFARLGLFIRARDLETL